ncbi:MAG: ribonuclease P protein component [Alphaproteobacteria bacterium]|nr:ribonuclease P protein component [Alphaproteobacteria bacterium]
MYTRKEELSALEMLTARSDFLTVQTTGKRWVSHGLTVYIKKNGVEKIRTGFLVTKKIDKSAVRRNRMKRRLRSVAADVLPRFAKPGHDYVLAARDLTDKRPYDALLEDLKWCLLKTGFSRESV